VLTPWGDRPPPPPRRSGPWPGALPAPHPATVYREPVPVAVEGVHGERVRVTDRGALLGEPAWITADGSRRRVTAWAGPWPLVERGWDPGAVRRTHRFQVVDAAGRAFALLLDEDAWSAEGRYD
ncbi:MAG: DNA polymerase Y family protein, partial [Microbacteriaceae bacterium]|nr:DNA polymerase Y family protein [Microbacteriaceae bacterium]